MAWTKCPCGHPLPCMSVGGVLSVFILFHHAVLLTESAFLNRRSEHETLGLTRKNPLLNVVEEDFPPFDSVQPDDVVPALTQLLDKAKDEVELFEQELQKPGFEPGVQTLLQPYSLLGEPLWAAHSVVSHLKSVKDSPELRKAMDVIRPKLVQHSERVSQSQPLFAAFQALRNSSSFAKLTPAQKRVVDLELQGFELGGIGLKGLARQEFNNITRKLSNLSTSYSENVLDSTKAWRKVVTTPTALRGIPEGPLRVAAQAARQEPIDGEVARLVKANANQSDEVLGPFLLTLDGPAAGAVLTYAEDPTLRKEVFIESAKRASELAQPDNTPVLKEMLQLRQRQAELLGFRNYVELSMQSKMATTTSAMKLMQQLQEVARPHAVADWDGLLQFVKAYIPQLWPYLGAMAAAEASSWGWSNDAQPEQQQEQPQQAQDTAWSWSGEASAASNAASAPAAHEAPSAPAEDGNGGWSDTWTKGGSDNAASTDAPTDKWHTEGDPWSKKGVEGSANAGSADTPAQDTSGSAWNKWDNQQGDAPAQGGGNNGSSWNNWSGGGGAAASNGNHASNGASNWDWGGAPQEKKPMENIAKAQRQRLLAGCQAFNAAQGLLSRLRDDELAELDSKLFEEDRLTGAGVDFDTVYADVPCVIKGPKTENIPPISTFSDLYTMFKEQIPPSLEDNIKRCRYHKPTPVQRYVLPCAFSGRDIMCCAQTGSGKTVAYLIPVLASMIRSHINAVGDLQEPYSGPVKPDCVIIAPTRELTLQIFDDARRFCHRTPYRVIRVYGQEAAKEQLADVAKGADVVIGTPGRLWDYVSAEVIDVKQVNCLVLDEADRMLDRGMSQWIRPTVSEYGMPDKENRQTMMFSATFPPEVQTLAQEYLYEHVWVGVGVIGGAVTTVTQQLMKITASKKFDRLMELIDEWFVERDNSGDSGARLMVFVNSKRQAKALDEYLFEKCSIDTCALHADLDQKKREEHLQSFRKGDIDVLVCTDVASRGLDIGGVNTVVNFDIPKDIGTYVQRIGRTGRIGHRGKAISFVTTGEDGNLWDDSNVLRDLVGVMKDANNAVPDWLESQFNAKGAEQAWDSWDNSKSWRQEQNQRDVRENQ